MDVLYKQSAGVSARANQGDSTMSLTVTDLAEEVRETNRRLTAAIDALRTEVTDLRIEVAKINTNLNWLKGIGRIVAGSAVAVLILVGTGVYRFGRVETAIAELQRDTGGGFGRVETSIGNLQRDTGELRKDATEFQAEFKARDDRLSRTLERVEKALPPVSKGNPVGLHVLRGQPHAGGCRDPNIDGPPRSRPSAGSGLSGSDGWRPGLTGPGGPVGSGGAGRGFGQLSTRAYVLVLPYSRPRFSYPLALSDQITDGLVEGLFLRGHRPPPLAIPYSESSPGNKGIRD